MSLFKCPKCSSRDVEIYTDRSEGWSRNDPGKIFHCRACGKLLYGKDSAEEMERQTLLMKKDVNKPVLPTEDYLKKHALELKQAQLLRISSQIESALKLTESYRDELKILRDRGANGEEFSCLFNIIKLEAVGLSSLLDMTKIPSPSLTSISSRWEQVSLPKMGERFLKAKTLAQEELLNKPAKPLTPPKKEENNGHAVVIVGNRARKQRLQSEAQERSTKVKPQPKKEAPTRRPLGGIPWPSTVSHSLIVVEALPPTPSPVYIKDTEKCSWMDCKNLRVGSSIYCSVKCKNKNAHWRERERRLAKIVVPKSDQQESV